MHHDVQCARRSLASRGLLRLSLTTVLVACSATAGKAQPQYVVSPTSPMLRFHYSVDQMSLVDVDGDRDIDMVFIDFFTPAVLLNDGHGRLAPAGGRAPTFRGLICGTTGDIDRDGDADLVLLHSDPPRADRLAVLANDGRGFFTPTTDVPIAQLATTLISLFDADGDGDLDMLLSGGLSNGLLVNVGGGAFRDETASRLPFGTVWCRPADIDGDGAVDILNTRTGRLEVLLNDGSGRFAMWQSVAVPWFGLWTLPVAGDVDNDGDQDVLVVTWAQNSLLINDGTGGLTYDPTRLPTQVSLSHRAAFGDVDDDGDLDIVIANGLNNVTIYTPWLYLNDGQGRFQDATARRLAVSPTGCVEVGLVDLDGDRDLDICFGRENAVTGYQPMVFLTNRVRHVDPLPTVRIGVSWQILVWGEAGFAQATQLAFPFVSTQLVPGPIHLPWGTVFLGTGVIPFPAVVLSPPLGAGVASLPVPNDTLLVGQTAHVQCLIVHDLSRFGITSLGQAQILR